MNNDPTGDPLSSPFPQQQEVTLHPKTLTAISDIPVPPPPVARPINVDAMMPNDLASQAVIPNTQPSIQIDPEFSKTIETGHTAAQENILIIALLGSSSVPAFFKSLRDKDAGNVFENAIVDLYKEKAAQKSEFTVEDVKNKIQERGSFSPLIQSGVINEGIAVHLQKLLNDMLVEKGVGAVEDEKPGEPTTVVVEAPSLASESPEPVVSVDTTPAPTVSVGSTPEPLDIDVTIPPGVRPEMPPLPSIEAFIKAHNYKWFLTLLDNIPGNEEVKERCDTLLQAHREDGKEISLKEIQDICGSIPDNKTVQFLVSNINLLPGLISLMNEELKAIRGHAETAPAPLDEVPVQAVDTPAQVTETPQEIPIASEEETANVSPAESGTIDNAGKTRGERMQEAGHVAGRMVGIFGNRLIRAGKNVAQKVAAEAKFYAKDAKDVFSTVENKSFEAKRMERHEQSVQEKLQRVEEKTAMRRKYLEEKGKGTWREEFISKRIFKWGEEWAMLEPKTKLLAGAALGCAATFASGGGALAVAGLGTLAAVAPTLRSVEFYRKLKFVWPTRNLFRQTTEAATMAVGATAFTLAAFAGFGLGKLLGVIGDMTPETSAEALQETVPGKVEGRVVETSPQAPVSAPQSPSTGPSHETAAVREALAEQEKNLELMTRVYDVQQGDNMWNIIKKEAEGRGLFESMSEGDRDRFIIEKIRVLERDPTSYGVTSGQVGSLDPGDKIEIGKLFAVDTSTISSLHPDMPTPGEQGSQLTGMQKTELSQITDPNIREGEPASPLTEEKRIELSQITNPNILASPGSLVDGFLQNVSSYERLFGEPIPGQLGAFDSEGAFNFLRLHAGESVLSLYNRRSEFDAVGQHVTDRLAGIAQAYFQEDVKSVVPGSAQDKSVVDVLAAVDKRLPHNA